MTTLSRSTIADRVDPQASPAAGDWSAQDENGTFVLVALEGQTDALVDLADSTSHATATTKPTVTDLGGGVTSRGWMLDWFSESDGADVYADAFLIIECASDGSIRAATLKLQNEGDSFIRFVVAGGGSTITLQGDNGQTDPLLSLDSWNTGGLIQATGDDKVGFYGQAPVARQTGVAVDAAGIHAALVNLGLITA